MCFNKNPEITEVLLKAGAEVNATTEDGTTALMMAALFNVNPNITAMLLKAGADTTAKNNDGMTALDFARKNRVSRNESVLFEAYKAQTENSTNITNG